MPTMEAGNIDVETFRGDGRDFEEKKRLIPQGIGRGLDRLRRKYPHLKLITEPQGRKGDRYMGLRATVVHTKKKVTTCILTVAWSAGDIARPKIRARHLYQGFLGELNRRLGDMKLDHSDEEEPK